MTESGIASISQYIRKIIQNDSPRLCRRLSHTFSRGSSESKIFSSFYPPKEGDRSRSSPGKSVLFFLPATGQPASFFFIGIRDAQLDSEKTSRVLNIRRGKESVERVCKPNSVPCAARNGMRRVAVIHLGPLLRGGSSNLPGCLARVSAENARLATGRRFTPIWSCTGWGFPGGRVATPPVRSYRTISPLPDPAPPP